MLRYRYSVPTQHLGYSNVAGTVGMQVTDSLVRQVHVSVGEMKKEERKLGSC